MGHQQPSTLIHSNNKCVIDIVQDTIKQQQLGEMFMFYFWICEQQKQETILMFWYPGAGNLDDYVTKHHLPLYHQLFKIFYAYTKIQLNILIMSSIQVFCKGISNPSTIWSSLLYRWID